MKHVPATILPEKIAIHYANELIPGNSAPGGKIQDPYFSLMPKVRIACTRKGEPSGPQEGNRTQENKKREVSPPFNCLWCRRWDSNPHVRRTLDFESSASANSTTSAGIAESIGCRSPSASNIIINGHWAVNFYGCFGRDGVLVYNLEVRFPVYCGIWIESYAKGRNIECLCTHNAKMWSEKNNMRVMGTIAEDGLKEFYHILSN